MHACHMRARQWTDGWARRLEQPSTGPSSEEHRTVSGEVGAATLSSTLPSAKGAGIVLHWFRTYSRLAWVGPSTASYARRAVRDYALVFSFRDR